jgi:hypothetical protein
MLPIITDIENIILAPCKDSLYDIINKNGLAFYKSSISIKKLDLFLNDFNRKKNEVISFMNENNINEEAEYEHIILWNNTMNIKDYIVQSFASKKETHTENDSNENKLPTVSINNVYSYEYNNIYEYESDEYEFNDYTYNNYDVEYLKEEIYEDDFIQDDIDESKGCDDDYY